MNSCCVYLWQLADFFLQLEVFRTNVAENIKMTLQTS
jgi:hypothetical protein